MKKYGIWLVIGLVLLPCLIAARAEGFPSMMDAALIEPGADDIAYEDALAIARDVWDEEVGFTDESSDKSIITAELVTVPVDGQTVRAWHMVLRGNETTNSLDCAALIASPSGEVLGAESFILWDDKRPEWVSALGHELTWSLAHAELYARLYKNMPDAETVCSQPKEGQITQEKAVEIVRDLLINEQGTDAAKLDALQLGVQFHAIIKENAASDSAVDYWYITYFDPATAVEGALLQQPYLVTLSAEDGAILWSYNIDVDGPANG